MPIGARPVVGSQLSVFAARNFQTTRLISGLPFTGPAGGLNSQVNSSSTSISDVSPSGDTGLYGNANVSCISSTPAPPRQRRRPNQDLQERLARCEDLLEQYAGDSAPSPSVRPSPVPSAVDGYSPSDPSASGPTGSTSPKWKPRGKMVKDQGGVRFSDSHLWTTIQEELQAIRDIVNTDDDSDGNVLGADDLSRDHSIDLFLPRNGNTSTIEGLLPEPVHVFRLWQIFLDRVNPMSKIIHVPSVQPYVTQAATNMADVPLNYQALLFSIFTMAIISLSEMEAVQLLGTPREYYLRKFTIGTKTTLTNFNYLRNYDMVALQSLLLYLLSLQNRYDRHAAWIFSGMIVRIAQKMGYHRDGEGLRLTPFETEMRRRMWWQIILQDAKHALVSGLSYSILPVNWDTKMPQNVNDADLFPESVEPIRPREGPTEMAFCLVSYQIAKCLVHSENIYFRPRLEAAIIGDDVPDGVEPSTPAIIARYRTLVTELENDVRELEERYIDASAGKVHIAALSIRPMLVSKISEVMVPMREQPEWGTEILNTKDNLFKIMIMNSEHSTDTYEVMEQAGFLWFFKLNFQLDFFSVMTGQLCQRPIGSLADRAWKVMEKIYLFHVELLDMSQKAHVLQAQLVLRAWKSREKAFKQAGQALKCPDFIHLLQECALADARGLESFPQISLAQPTLSSQQMSEMDQFLGNYVDVSELGWDAWGDANMSNAPNPIPEFSFDEFGMGGMNLNDGGV
ncbi:hypothetical protein QQZ08_001315 [Neonectria magnoliae]|uniref:Xylanolytic transcriptional activator regulatory domain-containing protein n=1 Tax=Neonectria magnoliae TaxID=2732573 RepID=A0ABR1IFM2_9HYPO